MNHIKTKIIATVGPSCNSKEKLLELIMAGVSIFRINFSHGTHKSHQEVVDYIKSINEDYQLGIVILQDLQGPKIRIGEIRDGEVLLEKDKELIITTEAIKGDNKRISTSYSNIVEDIHLDDPILLDDGKIELKVKAIKDKELITKIIHGGILSSNKGMNFPKTTISEPSLTKKDKRDMEFGVKNDVEWIAISFVKTAGDLLHLKEYIKKSKKNIKIIAKIERPEAIQNIDSIIKESDAIMIARGDLGIEIDMSEIPIIQKDIITRCNVLSRPVIVATQMMESMITSPMPTRAEISDVANAVEDGADTVMLSAETAKGKFPILTVQKMVKTIQSVETHTNRIYNKYYTINLNSSTFSADTVIDTAIRMATITNAKAIIAAFLSDYNAFQLAKHRPKADIYFFTDRIKLVNQLNLVWGIRPHYYITKNDSIENILKDTEKILLEKRYINKGDVCIHLSTIPISHQQSDTNMVKISIIE